MARRISFIAVLAVFAASYAGGQSANQPVTNTTPYGGPILVTPTAAYPGPFGGPLLVTPSASFPSPQPTAGISVDGRAGISLNSAAPAEGSATGDLLPSTGDVLPSTTVVGGTTAAQASQPSVAEVAMRLKEEKATHNARVLTNDDVEKMLGNTTGVTVAKNMPPLRPGVAPASGASQGAATQSAGTQSATVQQRQAAPPASTNQGQPASADNATTPQINQNQQSNDAAGSRKLPATSTFLPLLGLLGVVSGGLGLWFRRFVRP
jgi:hypothetical protein